MMQQTILTFPAMQKEYRTKQKLFNILTCAVLTDIFLTFIMVVYFNAIELNPLCINFTIFFIVKCVASILGLLLIWALSQKYWVKKYMWLSCVYFLILWYNIIIFKNLYEVVMYFLSL